ncbi:MAG: glycoside hydrolase family 28 protein [Alphaproteobacteria bacterium]|nr:glycoside hydrolase family 28 protein [Alphaproteobacteria bacterium]MDE2111715.1 glycoside hydrolase family 28 protein [Alphaproteobacteria bacterium]
MGNGSVIDSPSINKAIDYVAERGGGTVYFPPGIYASYSIRLKSHVTLHLEVGASILAASTPPEGMASGGYDAAEPQGPWEPYQDFGHNHWHNSLIWGENLEDIAIAGLGMIHGKGLNRGIAGNDFPSATVPGAGNKSIALKNCRHVLLRDFKILQGGWFGLLATGVDNLTVDNLIVDTNRDGFDFDCCRNVRVTNCTVNSPWDDGICLKSSYALGYARATENVTIDNCFVTGGYELGSVIDGTWRKMSAGFKPATGRIKCGTKSNGGFKNIAVTNCVFEACNGFAIESMDGALCEDITISNIAMRDLVTGPFFIRLGRRMRGPAGVPIGTIKRLMIGNITSSNAAKLPSIIAGVTGHPVEDVQIHDVYLQQVGGGSAELAKRLPPLNEDGYPDPPMFGELPATGFFIRQVRNVEMSNVEVAVESADARPAFWMQDVSGADFFRVRPPPGPCFALDRVTHFRTFGSRDVSDKKIDVSGTQTF